MMPFNPHPVCAKFPMMSEAELNALAQDIKAHGQRHAVIVSNGLILDGRNRIKACEIAGVKCRYEEYEGDEPVAFIVSENIHRRNLTIEQRAELALELEAPLAEEAKARKDSGRPWGSKNKPLTNQQKILTPRGGEDKRDHTGEALHAAAKAVGVSRGTAYRLKRLKEESPGSYEDVMSGRKTIGGAYCELWPDGRPATKPNKKESKPPTRKQMEDNVRKHTPHCHALVVAAQVVHAMEQMYWDDPDIEKALRRIEEMISKIRAAIIGNRRVRNVN